MTNQRVFQLPTQYSSQIELTLHELGYSFEKPGKLIDSILKLADFYQTQPVASTPWSEPWARAASVAYYFPLNYARCSAVAREASRLGFFAGLEGIMDFGSGTGSALFAFLDAWPAENGLADVVAVDTSANALELGLKLCAQGREYRRETLDAAQDTKIAKKTAVLASYLVTELDHLPRNWFTSDALVLIEPSTREDGRSLMQTRQILIDEGFEIWAPCTHQLACPLLTLSERDWCHDRIHWQSPQWFSEIEKRLPIKNRTLTYSYLLARRGVKPPRALAKLARLTGDTMAEKGKTRQAVCRGPRREFLSWFPNRFPPEFQGTELVFQRGNLVRLRDSQLQLQLKLNLKSSEVRLKEPGAIFEIAPDKFIAELENEEFRD